MKSLYKTETNLSPLEAKLLKLICLRNKVIADKVGLSVRTTEKIIERILDKLAATRNEAIVIALKCGIIELDEVELSEKSYI
jgi:DNA-binding NarL/FixJ family response regulator